MTIDQLYKYAYIKKPLDEVYPDISLVPDEFIIEWLKDTFDYERIHSDEEINNLPELTPEQILNWLEQTIPLVYEVKQQQIAKLKT